MVYIIFVQNAVGLEFFRVIRIKESDTWLEQWQSRYMYVYSGLALFASVSKFSGFIHNRSWTDLEGVRAATNPNHPKIEFVLNFQSKISTPKMSWAPTPLPSQTTCKISLGPPPPSPGSCILSIRYRRFNW